MANKTNFRIELPIDQLVGGGVMEKLNEEFEKVFENIHDPNMKPDIKRSVTATFGFTPDAEKEIIALDINFATKLAPVEGLATKIITDKDLKTNTIAAQEELVPNPVVLAPYRTFTEIEQVPSEFVFRMSEGPKFALFEADGGAWKNDAILLIEDYLVNQLQDEINDNKIVILS